MQTPGAALVLDGDQRSALATVRSLGRRNVTVHVAETHPHPLAASSRYCRSALIHPDPATHPDDFRRWLHEMDREFAGAVIMPMTDWSVPLVLECLPGLHNLRSALPSCTAYEAASDKYRLFEMARNAGVPAPQTIVVSPASSASLLEKPWRFPLVVKPRRSAMRAETGAHKRPVRYVHDRTELIGAVETMFVGAGDELLVQEYVAGTGAGVFALYEHRRPRFFFAHRRIREKPPSGGVSVLSESVSLAPALVAAARDLLDRLAWHGVAMVEFKVDALGRATLIEINARFWGSLQLAVDCDADFPWYVYQLAMGNSPLVPEEYIVGNRLRWWLGDLDNLYARVRDSRWTPTTRQKIAAIAQFLSPWQPRVRGEFLRWNDPAPMLAALRQYVAAFGGKK